MSNLYQVWKAETEGEKGNLTASPGTGPATSSKKNSVDEIQSLQNPDASHRGQKANGKPQLVPTEKKLMPSFSQPRYSAPEKNKTELKLAPRQHDEGEQNSRHPPDRSLKTETSEDISLQVQEGLDSSRATETPQHITNEAVLETTGAPESTPDAVIEGVLAQDPSQIRQQLLDEAVTATNVRAYDESRKSIRWIPISIAVAVVLVLGAVAAIVGVRLSRNDVGVSTESPSGMPSSFPSMAPSEVPTVGGFSEVASAIEDLFKTRVEDSGSPQFKAARWMAEVDEFQGLASSDPDRFQQRYALVVFYYSTGGENWKSQANFLSPSLHECEWNEPKSPSEETFLGVFDFRGVVCSSERVAAIEFVDHNMAGSIPPEIGALSSLLGLILIFNPLAGTLPPALFDIPNLQYLTLPFNDFSGSIPTEIGQISNLIQIWIQTSSLTGPIPSEMGMHTNLQGLTLADSALTGTIPETLHQLSNLLLFDISFNQLRGSLPQSLNSTWPNLETLSLNFNQLSGNLPYDLGSLSALTGIAVLENNFTGQIPKSVVESNTIRFLDLSDNGLTGTLPSDLSRLSGLERLSLGNNRLSGTLPASLGNLTKLTSLTVHGNAFTGTIPPELGSLTKLKSVLFQENQFNGTVPQTLRQWEDIEFLTLEGNLLTGDISFLCDESDPSEPFSPNVTYLHADCLEQVICPCCNLCCDADGVCEAN